MQSTKLEQKINDAGDRAAEVTQLASATSSNLLAAGYSDGAVRLWRIDTQECTAVLTGHRSAVSALAFSGDSSQLASGGKDTDVIVWDVLGETGMFRLRAHTDQVTGVAFLDRHSKLVSVSKDSALRVWDLTTQHCSQFVAHHEGAVRAQTAMS